jgi:hypothetical protein
MKNQTTQLNTRPRKTSSNNEDKQRRKLDRTVKELAEWVKWVQDGVDKFDKGLLEIQLPLTASAKYKKERRTISDIERQLTKLDIVAWDLSGAIHDYEEAQKETALADEE